MLILGFDIGGTKCAVITAEYNGDEIKILNKQSCPTDRSIPAEEMIEYNKNNMPTFIVECAMMLINNQIVDYMTVLETCRKMAREDVNM